MPDYTFTLDPAASGLPYVVKDRAGLTVDSGTLESDADAVTLTVDLPFGVYEAKASAATAPYASTPAFFATGSIASGGGGASETEILYLAGSVTAGSLNDDEFALTITLDPDKESSGDWWEEGENGFVLIPRGSYLARIASMGEATYPGIPAVVNVDVVDNGIANNFAGLNLGHSSDGTDDSPSFTPQLVTPLDLLSKDVYFTTSEHSAEMDIVGFNNGDQAVGATLDFEVRIAICRAFPGPAYTADDFA